VWKWERKGKRLAVEIECFAQATAATRRAATDEAERLAEFLEGDLALEWT